MASIPTKAHPKNEPNAGKTHHMSLRKRTNRTKSAPSPKSAPSNAIRETKKGTDSGLYHARETTTARGVRKVKGEQNKENLSDLTVAEIKVRLKKSGIPYSNANKAELRKRLEKLQKQTKTSVEVNQSLADNSKKTTPQHGNQDPTDYWKNTIPKLRELCIKRRIDHKKNDKKLEFVELLEEADRIAKNQARPGPAIQLDHRGQDPHAGVNIHTTLAEPHQVLIDQTNGILYDAPLQSTEEDTNTDKFYHIQVLQASLGSCSTLAHYGRNGTKGRFEYIPHDTQQDAIDHFKKTFQDKSGLGWDERNEGHKHLKYRYEGT